MGEGSAAAAAIVERRFRRSTEVPTAFFREKAGEVAAACQALARAFHAGHRLLVLGEGAQRSDVVHLSVEFVHPVIVGKRALPALALLESPAEQLRVIGEPGDVAIGLSAGADASIREALEAARRRGLVVIALTGAAGDHWGVDHHFAVPSDDPCVVQEVHETLYHTLWELVHLFLDHPGTLR